MDTIAARRPTAGVARTPSAAVLCGVVVAGLAGAACTILLTLTSDHIPEPGVHAGLAVWGILGFVLAGVVAWWRRPESRFGILMVLAGTAYGLSPYFRMSTATSVEQIEEGCRRIAGAVALLA